MATMSGETADASESLVFRSVQVETWTIGRRRGGGQSLGAHFWVIYLHFGRVVCLTHSIVGSGPEGAGERGQPSFKQSLSKRLNLLFSTKRLK